MKLILILFIPVILFFVPILHAQDHRLFVDNCAERTLKEWDIPGLALSVIHSDDLPINKGYGVKTRGF